MTLWEADHGGRFYVLKRVRSEYCHWNWRTCSAEGNGGHLKVLKWVRSKGCPWD